MNHLVTSLETQELTSYVTQQLKLNFPDGKNEELSTRIDEVIHIVLGRVWLCFSKIKSRYYKNEDGDVYFNHLHGD